MSDKIMYAPAITIHADNKIEKIKPIFILRLNRGQSGRSLNSSFMFAILLMIAETHGL